MFIGILFGFKMGRRTKDEDIRITMPEIKKTDTGALDTPDIFSEHVNDGLEGDPDARLRTV